MLSISFLTVGKLKEHWMQQGVAEYQKRMAAYCQFTQCELAEYRLGNAPGAAEIAAGLAKEAEAILGRIAPRDKVVALCIEGRLQSSEQLAERLQSYALQTSRVHFVIGSSHGLADIVKHRADFCLSCSPMTFPHQLMRVLLAEQVYRALSISSGAKYHK